MTRTETIGWSTISLLTGILLYAVHQEWIIIQINRSATVPPHSSTMKKTITLSYWHANKWHKETVQSIEGTTVEDTIARVVTHWLTLLDTEHIVPKKVTVQSVALSPSKQEAYLSFDRNFLPKEWSLRRKWLLVESLLRTIADNHLPITALFLLVHHQPLIDAHLDFRQAWPLTGFIQGSLQY
jgi:hypothetical protein